jgi:hypothetical protein
MATTSVLSRFTEATGAEGFLLAKLLNYDTEDYGPIIAMMKEHFTDIEIKTMDDPTHLSFGGGRRFTIVGIKPASGKSWEDFEFRPGQTIYLSGHIECKTLTNTRYPMLKNCPTGGRNSTGFLAVAFNKTHSDATSSKVCCEIIERVKDLCKDLPGISKLPDQLYLDVRYGRTTGYVLRALSEHFPMIMKEVISISGKLTLDEDYGKFTVCNTSTASTLYHVLAKKNSAVCKAVIFNLPSEIDEVGVLNAVLKIYSNLTEMSEEGRTDIGLPKTISSVSADDFEIKLHDGKYKNGGTFRMAFVECPNFEIFKFPEEWRTTTLYSDNNRAAILEKSRKEDNEKEGSTNGSKSLAQEGKKRKQSNRSSPLEEPDAKFAAGGRWGSDDEELDDAEEDEDLDADDIDSSNFGQAGKSSTPTAVKKSAQKIRALQKKLKSFESRVLTKADITAMIEIGCGEMSVSVEDKMATHQTVTTEKLARIHSAYEELVQIDKTRMEAFKQALEECKTLIMSIEVSDEEKEAAVAEVMSMEGASQEMKEQFQKMMIRQMLIVQQSANNKAAAVVDQMTSVVNKHMLEASEAKEKTATNLGQLMLEIEPMPSTPVEEASGSSSSDSAALTPAAAEASNL